MKNLDLAEELYKYLPFPVSYLAHQCVTKKARGSAGKMRALEKTLEGLLRYLALLTLADYLRQNAPDAQLNRTLHAALSKAPALGGWMEMLRETAKAVVKSAQCELCIREVETFLFAPGSNGASPSPVIRLASELVERRNANSHSDHWPDAFVIAAYEQLREVLRDAAFLKKYRLVVPTEVAVGSSQVFTEVIELTGHNAEFRDAEQTVQAPVAWGYWIERRAAPVILADNKVVSVAFPFHMFHEEQDDLYRYDRASWDGDALGEMTYRGLRTRPAGDEDTLSVTRYGNFEYAHKRASLLLARVLGTPRELPPQRPRELGAVRAEIANHVRTFVPRLELWSQLEPCLNEPNGGFVYISGPEGVGKSAFASFLIHEMKWPGLLIKKTEGRDQPVRIIQHLLWQLGELHGLLGPIPDDLPSLAECLRERLETLAKQPPTQGSRPDAVVVIDGLDQLEWNEGSAVPGFVLDPPPLGVWFVLLSNSCPLLTCLSSTSAEWRPLDISDLSSEQSDELLERRWPEISPDQRAAVRQAAGENPKRLVAEGRKLKSGASASRAGREKTNYEKIVQLSRDLVGSNADNILDAFVCSRNPLSFEELAEIAHVPADDIERLVKGLASHIHSRDGRHEFTDREFRARHERERPEAIRLMHSRFVQRFSRRASD